jgi:hypothetical protein
MYVSNKRFAQEVVMKITGDDKKVMTVNSNMVSDGTYMYTWGTDKKVPGMKIKIDEAAPNTDDKNNPASKVDLDKKMDLNCNPWTLDESKFKIPTDVTFTDISSMMENLKNIKGIPSGVMPSIPK